MFVLLQENRIRALMVIGVLCFFLAMFILVIKFQSFKKKISLFEIELCTTIVAFADALGSIYSGQAGNSAGYIVRVAYCVVFIGVSLDVYFLNFFIANTFMETGKFKKLPKSLLAGFVLPALDIILIIISQFTHMYYYFDECNNFVRAPLYFFPYIIPFVIITLEFFFLLENRKLITVRLFVAFIVFVLLFFISGVQQLLFESASWVNFAISLAALVLFVLALADQNNILMKAANTELRSGLPNSYGFIYEVEKISHTKNITDYNAYYFDIVRMSRINNKYGKDQGDEIIVSYANYIRNNIDRDEVVGRLGGNYFVALIKKSNTDRFLEMLSAVPVEIKTADGKETIQLAAVVGGYTISKKRIHAGELIGNAAAAVNYAKSNKKKVAFLDDELEAELMKKKVFEETIRVSLKNNEFVPFYQPKVDLKTKKLCGAEALARWIHDGKFISPAEFVPVMEKNGSVAELDFYILEHVCEDMRRWIDEGLNPPRVSVNFSRANLGNPILAEAIKNVVEKHNVPKDLIQIEVTETVDEYPMSYLVGVVEALKRYGLSVAIDDFGTGSSSINLLKQVVFDVLKIDREFVEYKSDKEKQLLSFIISMSKSLGIDVIAEGVEKPEQIAVLKEMGCNKIQGFIFDKPLQKVDYEERIKVGIYE